MDRHHIKNMQLYDHVERIHNDLAEAGYDRKAPLTVEALSPFDQLHYYGTDSVDEAIAFCGIGPDSHVLDIGSGLGGPARYAAQQSGCRVTAIELQEDLSETAKELTARTGLSSQVNHICGDALKVPLGDETFDAMISWLALFHIPERATLFPPVHAALTSGGRIFVEDLYQRAPFTADERVELTEGFFGHTLPDGDGYVAELEAAGFRDVSLVDMSDDWTAFTNTRVAAFREARADRIRIHGEEVVDALDAFYSATARLFAGGHLGGARITAIKA